MKGSKIVVLLIITALFSTAGGAYAASNLTVIKAYLNGDIKFIKNGTSWRPTDDKGNEVLPITYDGTTYLPLRVFANGFNVPVSYDEKSKTVLLGSSSKGINLYAEQVKAESNSGKFYDVIDKKQLVFGGKQYNGAYAFQSYLFESYNVKLDFGEKFNTLHLVLVGKENLKFKVFNGNKQQLSEEMNLVKGEVKEVDIDLQGSQQAVIYGYGADSSLPSDQFPLIYILKDSYVTNETTNPTGLEMPEIR
ncbi:stalk domain-containing protein [Paenibacillus eucommiae]|uniref:Copper amine oxidase-like N-terminal domain-containing protein n=1 Tax=Paenibacillus eucommiae TaxID=1355755 RepID=A0ABS4INS0_9BACL|nr:stalk domain-containing protein [Paenibacillus eucommiae]MBP1989173.1 hypothetical protein [Paenibacillus eucommiae]